MLADRGEVIVTPTDPGAAEGQARALAKNFRKLNVTEIKVFAREGAVVFEGPALLLGMVENSIRKIMEGCP